MSTNLQSEVHSRVRDGDNPSPPVRKSVSNCLPIDSFVDLEGVSRVRVDSSASDDSLLLSEELGGIGTGGKEKEDDEGEEERWESFDKEEDLVLSDLGLDVVYAEGDETGESTCDCTSTDEETDTLGEFVLLVPKGEVESHRLTEHGFSETDNETTDVETSRVESGSLKSGSDGPEETGE